MTDESVLRRDLMKTVGAGAAAGLAAQGASARTFRTTAGTTATSCPSVEFDLNTGYDQDAGTVQPNGATDDDWQITYDEKNGSSSVPRPADVVDSSGWPSPFTGSSWISIEPDQGWFPPANSFYEYTYCFCLHPEFQNPQLDFTLQADDRVDDILLNGQSLSFNGNGNFGGDPIDETYTDPALFVGGENCLTVVVEDTHQVITGMNLVGSMTAEDADCDCCQDPCDLAVEKDARGTFKPGTVNEYVIQVCNTCPSQACDGTVEVTDQLPDSLDPVTAGGTGWSTSIQDGTLNASHDNTGGLDPGACLPDLVVEVEVPSLVENCVDVTVPEYDQSASDCTEHEIGTCGDTCLLAVDKSVQDEFCFGGTGIYGIQVCNVGEYECGETVMIKDPLPDGIRPVDASGTDWSTNIQNGTVFAEHQNGGLAPGDCLPMLYIETEVVSEAEWPGDTATAENCVELTYGDGSTDVNCVEHQIYNC